MVPEMTAQTYYSPFIPTFGSNGAPVAGAKLVFYYTGTTTYAPIYADSGLVTQLANPVVADAAGKYPSIYLSSSITYRVRQLDPNGAQIGTDYDPYIPGAIDTGAASGAATSAAAAAASASAASTSATNAATSASTASSAATTAQNYATTAVNAPGTSADSTTSLTIGTGSQSLTVTTGKSFALGMFVVLASKANATNYMYGQITAFTSGSGAMTVNVSTTNGTGTYSDWTVSLSAAGAAGGSGYVAKAGDTMTGKLTTVASGTGGAGFNIPAGAAPTSPSNGDAWTTTSGLYVRINGVTYQFAPFAGGTFTGKVTTVASASGGAGINLPHGSAPTSPTNGDIWTTTSGLYARINGTTVGPYVTGGSYAASGANTDITSLQESATLSSGGTIAANSIGYRGLPLSSQTQGSTITLALTDSAKRVANTSGGWIIPANGSVAFPTDTVIVLHNDSSSTQTVAITTDTLTWAGSTTTGTRTVAANGFAYLTKTASTKWIISGNLT